MNRPSISGSLVFAPALVLFALAGCATEQPGSDGNMHTQADADACFSRGVAKMHKGDDDGAISEFTKAIELKPDFAKAYYLRGVVKGKNRDHDGAMADMTKVIQLKPDDADAYYLRGASRLTTSDWQGAIADETAASGLQPNSAKAYYLRAQAKRANGDLEGANADIAKANGLRGASGPQHAMSGTKLRLLGDRCRNGTGMPRDLSRALQYYREAAALGDAGSMTNIGWMYDQGLGVKQDVTIAVSWFRKAADRGDPGAMTDLGVMYEAGRGARQDYPAALDWYRKAADRGNGYAMFRIGALYENGSGVAKDSIMAALWYGKAADAGDADAKDHLRALIKNDRLAESKDPADSGRKDTSRTTGADRVVSGYQSVGDSAVEIALYDKVGAGSKLFATAEVKGRINFDSSGIVGDADSLARIQIDGKWLPLTRRKMIEGRAIVTTEDGRNYSIFHLGIAPFAGQIEQIAEFPAVAVSTATQPSAANHTAAPAESTTTREAPKEQVLDGAVCGMDKTNHTIRVVPWDKERRLWDKNGFRIFKLAAETVIDGETKGTVAELDARKVAIKSFHLTGIGSNGVTGDPFEIRDLSQLLHRRVAVSWTTGTGVPVATVVSLPYLFAGESMPAMVGNSGSSLVGSDDVTIGG